DSDASPAAHSATRTTVRAVPPISVEEPPDRLGSALRWWTVVSTTCTSMVFVFAFASLLRRAESRPALDLESDEAAVVDTSRAPPPGPALPVMPPEPAAVPEPVAAPEPAASPEPIVLPPPEAEPPVRELPPQRDPPPVSKPRRPRPPKPVEDDPGELMPIRPRGNK
ncbi:MAG TPA: hypothetical protein VGB85_29630, partial [Nannocystis sp.]